MKTQTYAGMDVVGNRYILCLLDSEGKQPRYFSGRHDTGIGRKKFLSRLSADTQALLREGPLSALAFKEFGPSMHLGDLALYDSWYHAGIEIGRQRARFAALYVYRNILGNQRLTEKLKTQLLENQGEEMQKILAYGEKASFLAEKLLKNDASLDEVEQALHLMESAMEGLT